MEPMANLILADRNDGRIIAGLVTSLVFNWNRLPIGLRTAIICHASETGFGSQEAEVQADERIMAFIRTHHQAVCLDTSRRSWSPRLLWSAWIRRRRLVGSVSLRVPAAAAARVHQTWAERVALLRMPGGSRRGLSSEAARGAARVKTLLGRVRRLPSEAGREGSMEVG